jgi:elongation factor P hydroxylase
MPSCQELIGLFEQTFYPDYATRLVAGGDEPEYIPATLQEGCSRIIFTRDYCASALHEIAHWCVAGPLRRRQVDYGYWYQPDGRNQVQQALFEQVEVKPQALEWLFSEACGLRFRISADNLINDTVPSLSFKQAIVEQAQHYCSSGLNHRAARWLSTLMAYYQTAGVLDPMRYTLEALN